MKIAIIGYSGSGKSTLARVISQRLSIPALFLDTVQFLPDWQVRPQTESVEIVREFLKNNPDWVIDGNYRGFLQEERLLQADRIVFMDFSALSCFARVCRRYRAFKGKSRESMSDGCDEKLDLEFIFWVLFKGRTLKRRRHFAGIVKKYGHKTTVIRNQKQLDEYAKGLGC